MGIWRRLVSEQDLAIFKLVHAGLSTRAIAAALSIETMQVDVSIRRVCRQLGVTRRRDAAVMLASEYGWPGATAKKSPHWPYDNQTGSFGDVLTSEIAPIVDESNNVFAYVRDVGSQSPAPSGRLPAAFELNELLSFFRSDSSNHIIRQLLVIVIVMLGAAFTVSILVAAMQGFEQIMKS